MHFRVRNSNGYDFTSNRKDPTCECQMERSETSKTSQRSQTFKWRIGTLTKKKLEIKQCMYMYKILFIYLFIICFCFIVVLFWTTPSPLHLWKGNVFFIFRTHKLFVTQYYASWNSSAKLICFWVSLVVLNKVGLINQCIISCKWNIDCNSEFNHMAPPVEFSKFVSMSGISFCTTYMYPPPRLKKVWYFFLWL